ncbi:GNAT family N-acetyltransferase [Kitasatospora sp. DSM 101779]|uniref:GNAT family N-acetyltransferase n=1 Tax=Kitasatospora sp. DSM 101779 TaxID=2853165 RepID=UPI0021D99BF7|nr:GNAT family N-acetyltransferase [Kitasatospora sp. DSM 101779]MCU7822436.1 GNAT family N-acetyltransferase [Kitasatospora sp. DSM 101779]
MTLTIRAFRPDDAPAACAALRAGRPYLVTTPETVAWQVAAQPHLRMLLAEADGRIVATARFGAYPDSEEPGHGFAAVHVVPAHRRQGAGTALLAATEEALVAEGVRHAHCWVDDDPAAHAFAAGRGYTCGRVAYFAGRDLTAPLPPLPARPPGVELRTAADFADDPHPLYLVDVEGTRDEPGDVDLADQGYASWLAEIWHRPDLDRKLTTVVLADGRPVGFSAAQTDGEGRYWSSFTTTVRAHRGRGLAKLAKADSLHRARAAGITAAYTHNDGSNAPMLAVNDWLGYERCAAEWKYSRELTA